MPVITFVFFAFCNVLAGVLLWRKQELFERIDFSGMIAAAIIGLAALVLAIAPPSGRGQPDRSRGPMPSDKSPLRKLQYLDLQTSRLPDRRTCHPAQPRFGADRDSNREF